MVEVPVSIIATVLISAFFFLLTLMTKSLRDISENISVLEEATSREISRLHSDVNGIDERLRETNNLLTRIDARRESSTNPDGGQTREDAPLLEDHPDEERLSDLLSRSTTPRTVEGPNGRRYRLTVVGRDPSRNAVTISPESSMDADSVSKLVRGLNNLLQEEGFDDVGVEVNDAVEVTIPEYREDDTELIVDLVGEFLTSETIEG